jgi:hypothetical protein
MSTVGTITIRIILTQNGPDCELRPVRELDLVRLFESMPPEDENRVWSALEGTQSTIITVSSLQPLERLSHLSGLLPLSLFKVNVRTTLMLPEGEALEREHCARVYKNGTVLAARGEPVEQAESALSHLAVQWINDEMEDPWWEWYEHYAPVAELCACGPQDLARGYGPLEGPS